MTIGCWFNDSDQSRCFVVMRGEYEEIIRARFRHVEDAIRVYTCRNLSGKLNRSLHTFRDFAEILFQYYRELTVLSCRGASAYRIQLVDHLLACGFVDRIQVGLVVLGSHTHVYMVRFSSQNDIFFILSIYELPTELAETFEGDSMSDIDWTRFGMCPVCLARNVHRNKREWCSRACKKASKTSQMKLVHVKEAVAAKKRMAEKSCTGSNDRMEPGASVLPKNAAIGV